MVANQPINSPSDPWLIGAALGGYLVLAFVLRFWGVGLLLPPNDILSTNNAPEPESHLFVMLLAAVGVLVTLLGVLQSVFFVQVSGKLTRISLWSNFLAISCFILATFGTKYAVLPLHILVLAVGLVAFPLGLVLSIVNILWGWLGRDRLAIAQPDE